MTITLNFAYATYAAGATVDLDNATEAALVAQGRAAYTTNPGTYFGPLTAAEQQNLRDCGAGDGTLTSTMVSALARSVRASYLLNAIPDFLVVANPTVAPTATVDANIVAGKLAVGTYNYCYTFLTADGGETAPSPVSSNVVVSGGARQVFLTIPISSDPRVVSRRVYRTTPSNPTPAGHTAANITGEYFRASSGSMDILDNTTTSFTDGTADTFVGNRRPYDNTTGRMWRRDGASGSNVRMGWIGETCTIIGYLAGPVQTNVNGGANLKDSTFIGAKAGNGLIGTDLSGGNYSGTIAIGSGAIGAGASNSDIQTSVVIGTNACGLKTSGSQCISIGTSSASNSTSAPRFAAIGTHAGIAWTTGGSYSIYLGNYCGDERVGGTGTILSTATAVSQLAIGFGTYMPSVDHIGVIGSQDTNGYIARFYLGSGYEVGTPRAVTVSATTGVGTDIAGSDIRIAGGESTGAGTAGNVIISGAPKGASSSTKNTQTDWWTFNAEGFITIKQVAAANVPTPAAGSINLFLDSGDGAFKYRNSAGVLKVIQVV